MTFLPEPKQLWQVPLPMHCEQVLALREVLGMVVILSDATRGPGIPRPYPLPSHL